MPGNVTESIYNGSVIVPLADVQHLEPHGSFLTVITKHTWWDKYNNSWANPIHIEADEAEAFTQAWCRYRHELEKDTLADVAVT